MNNTIATGTAVIITDGPCSDHYGQIADIRTGRWGTSYVVLVDGEFRECSEIRPSDAKGIGARIATDADIRRAKRQRKGVA